jgi:hypothetical protein
MLPSDTFLLPQELSKGVHPFGGRSTVPSVDFVVIVTPSAEQPNCAEVLCFPSATIIDAFNKVLAAREERNPDFSPKAPLFVD